MLKKGVIFIGIISALVLAGCSNQNSSKSNSNTTQTTQTKSSTTSYQKLDRADKRKVQFHFTASKAKNGYDINLKINNKTKKDVRFNLADISIYRPNDSELKAGRDNQVIVKEDSTVSVKRLFTGILPRTLNNSTNYFIYLDAKNKLSKFNFRIATGTDTRQANELTVTNTGKPTTNEEAPTAVSGNTQQTSGTNSGTSTNRPTAPARILTSPEMATALYLHSMNFPPVRGQDVTTVATSTGYKVVDTGVGDPALTVYYNFSGDELDASGNVLAKFSELAGPTQDDPDGWVYAGVNYNR